MAAKHAAAGTFDEIVSDFITIRARQLVAEAQSGILDHDRLIAAVWIGAATEILKELTCNA